MFDNKGEAGGFAGTHAAAVSVASLVAANKLAATESAAPILAALTANTLSEIVIAAWSGRRRFATQVVSGLKLVITTAWADLIFTPAR